MYDFYLTAPHGAEDLLAAELVALGIANAKARRGGAAMHGPLEWAYRACLWSRLASSVLVQIAELPASSGDALYEAARAIDWGAHLPEGASFAIAASGRASSASDLDNSHFAALRVKDGLVDALRERRGRRPNVDLEHPDLRLRLHLAGDVARLSVDLAGEGLHRRGYRVGAGPAPLRENLAATVLARAGFDAGHGALVDPMCGSGTLLIEGAWAAGDVAPGLGRARWGFEGWLGHGESEAAGWSALRAEAEARREAGRASLKALRVVGYDAEPAAVRAALGCVEAAGLRGVVHVERRALADVDAPALEGARAERGLVVCNPPWGKRLGTRRELESLYAALGDRLRAAFPDWDAAVLTGDPGLGRHLGIRAAKRNPLQDGPVDCQILRMRVPTAQASAVEATRARARAEQPRERSEEARAFANRLAKNRRQLRKWLRREGVTCYRIYDADIPEYAFAIDLYGALERDGSPGPVHAHVQEYAPPATVDPKVAARRRGEALAVVREDLELPRERVHLKRRQRQKGRAQYEKLGEEGREFVVAEGPAKLWVNLEDYLDTGLFLDHRPLRTWLSADPEGGPVAGRRVLNLFGYSGAVTVHAALGGAKHTTSVDLSRTYLEWTRRNLALNGFTAAGDLGEGSRGGSRRAAHQLVRADVLDWLRRQGALRWDVVICDPPSFSNSKKMADTFDVQRDHVELIRRCGALLSPGGLLVFSTNKRRFTLDREALGEWTIEPHAKSVPPDFARRAIHQAWLIRR